MALQHAEVNRIHCTSFLALGERVFNKVGLVVISTGSAVQKKSFQSLCIYDIHGYYSPSLTPISTASLHLSTHPSSLLLCLFSFSTPSFPPFLSLSLSLFFCPKRLAPRSSSWCRNFSKQCSSPLCGMKKEAKLWSFCQAPLDKWADREAVRALSRFFVLNQWSLPKGHPTLLQPLI